MSTEPEPGSPAWHDEQRREAEERAAYRMRRRLENLAMSASVIAAGVSTRVERKPADVAKESVEIAMAIFDQVDELAKKTLGKDWERW